MMAEKLESTMTCSSIGGTSDLRVSPFGGAHLLMGRWRTSNVGAEFRNPGRRSVGLRIRVIVVRPPERRQVPAEVQFEVARNAVTHTADPGTARPLTGPG